MKHNCSMKSVLVIGGGGREHALAWKLSQSANINKLYVAPGNAGTEQLAENVPIQSDDISSLLNFALQNKIDLTVVGPDNSLKAGIADIFQKHGLKIFGPTKKASEIEWSKTFAKQLMTKYGIPTAKFASFSSLNKAASYVSQNKLPIVIKVDGLALGKGVFICHTFADAKKALTSIMSENSFGTSGSKVVIEEYLEGTEISAHALCDGDNFILFPLSQDHKRIGEGNTGSNTGGMGTICPVSGPIGEIRRIVSQTLQALKKEGREFSGCLYPGIMLTNDGPKVLEFNARFGDPETQSYMRLLKNDLLEVFTAVTEKRLNTIRLDWSPGTAACIVLASKGYPGKYLKGFEISGLSSISENRIVIFHAGTKTQTGKLFTNSGRVLSVTSKSATLTGAINKAYETVEKISFKGKQFRRDIGHQFLQK